MRAAHGEAPRIDFRPLRDEDLPRLHGWLNEPAVVRWWEGADVSWPAVSARFGEGRWGATEHWLALAGGEPLGWIQCYCAADAITGETAYWQDHLDLERTGAIDYLVGGDGQRGRGLGSAMLCAFVRDVAFPGHPEWQRAAAGPFEANGPSCRALEKAGFRLVAVLDDPDGPCALMALERDAPGVRGDGPNA